MNASNHRKLLLQLVRRWTFLLLFLIGCNQVHKTEGAFAAPPIGATYSKAVKIPVLGEQVFSLHILSDNTAHLLVNGMLILDELVTYSINSRGCLNCRLSDGALRQLKKFRTNLKEVGYNVETDTPYVKVRTPLPAALKIHLKRQVDGIGENRGQLIAGHEQFENEKRMHRKVAESPIL